MNARVVAAEQAREILHTNPETTSDGDTAPASDTEQGAGQDRG